MISYLVRRYVSLTQAKMRADLSRMAQMPRETLLFQMLDLSVSARLLWCEILISIFKQKTEDE